MNRFNVADVVRVDDFASDRALQDFAMFKHAVLETIDGLGIPRFEPSDDPALAGSGSTALYLIDSRNPLPAPKPPDVDLIIVNRDAMEYLRHTFGWDEEHRLSSGVSLHTTIVNRPGLPLPVDLIWSRDKTKIENMLGRDGDTPPEHIERLRLIAIDYLRTAYRKSKMKISKGPASVVRAHAVAHHTEDHDVTEDPTWRRMVGNAMARLIAGVPEEMSHSSRKGKSNYPNWLGDLVSVGFGTHPAFKDIEPLLIEE